MDPFVSIVISTKNEEKHIGRCLKSIGSQSYPKDSLEVILVDNNSSDKTRDAAKEIAITLFPIKVSIFNHGPERSAQRNFGVEKSRGKYIFYLDADMSLSSDVVSDCVKKMGDNHNLVALYVKERVLGKKFWSKVRRFERSLYDQTVVDAVRFLRKSSFQQVGGFDERLYACEDWDLTRRLEEKGNFGFSESLIFHNESKFNIKKYLAKKEYYMDNIKVYIEKWGKEDPIIRKQFGICYRYFGIFFENHKWKALASHPIMAIGMYYLRFMVGLKYIFKR